MLDSNELENRVDTTIQKQNHLQFLMATINWAPLNASLIETPSQLARTGLVSVEKNYLSLRESGLARQMQ